MLEAVWQYYIDLAEGVFYLGEILTSIQILEKALVDIKPLGPVHPAWHRTLNRLGVLHYYCSRYEEAAQLLSRSVALQQSSPRPNLDELATALFNLGGVNKAQGRYEQAQEFYRRAAGIWEESPGMNATQLALVYQNLGETCLALKKHTEALFALRRSLVLAERRKPEDWITAGALKRLGRFYEAQERHTEAEPHYWRALEIEKRLAGRDDPCVARALRRLATLYCAQRKFARAEPLLRLAVIILDNIFGRSHPEFLGALHDLAELYCAQGSFSEAEPLFRLSLATFEQALGAAHPDVAERLQAYAGVLRTLRRNQEAARIEARAASIRRRHSIAV